MNEGRETKTEKKRNRALEFLIKMLYYIFWVFCCIFSYLVLGMILVIIYIMISMSSAKKWILSAVQTFRALGSNIMLVLRCIMILAGLYLYAYILILPATLLLALCSEISGGSNNNGGQCV